MSKSTKRSAQPIIIPALTEAEFMQQIIKAARLMGWRVYHTYDSRMSEPGFPDLTLLHLNPPDFLMPEIKTETGIVSSEQQVWLDGLRACGIESPVWRPSMAQHILERLHSSDVRTK